MRPSIKRKLLLSVISTLFIALIINSVLSNLVARNEVDEVFDAELLTLARIIRGIIDTPELEHNATEIGRALEETLKGKEKLPSKLIDYEKKILLQVWKKDASSMMFHSANAPDFAIAPLEKGFYYHNEGDQNWIVYVTALTYSNNWLLVGEIPDARDELGEDLISIFIASGILALILCSLVAITAIDISLRPLVALQHLLRNRTINNLNPIQLQPIPQELTPVVYNINHLFKRIEQGLAKEQQFVADAAHELRTPLAVIKLRTQHIQKKAGPELQEDLKQLEASVNRGNRLVEQLLLLARLDSHAIDGNMVETDIIELVRRSMAELWPSAEQHNVDLNLQTSIDYYPLTLNPTLLEIALQNLLCNAINYSPANTCITVSVKVANSVSITILDQGGGVNDADLDKLSERFYRTHGQDKPGSGLGLAIVQRICEQLNAQFSIKNHADGGLVVAIEFPAPNNK